MIGTPPLNTIADNNPTICNNTFISLQPSSLNDNSGINLAPHVVIYPTSNIKPTFLNQLNDDIYNIQFSVNDDNTLDISKLSLLYFADNISTLVAQQQFEYNVISLSTTIQRYIRGFLVRTKINEEHNNNNVTNTSLMKASNCDYLDPFERTFIIFFENIHLILKQRSLSTIIQRYFRGFLERQQFKYLKNRRDDSNDDDVNSFTVSYNDFEICTTSSIPLVISSSTKI